MPQDFTPDAFVDALTRLPEYGGFEALARGLSEAYPEATFSASSDDTYDSGFRYQSLPLEGGPLAGPFTMYSPEIMRKIAASDNIYSQTYRALWPTLTGLVNPPQTVARSIGKMGGPNETIDYNPEFAGDMGAVAGGGMKTAGVSESAYPKTLDGYFAFSRDLLDEGGVTDEATRRLNNFYKLIPRPSGDVVGGTTGTNVATGDVSKMAFTPPVGGGVNVTIKKGLDGSLDPESEVGTEDIVTEYLSPPPIIPEEVAATLPPQPGTIPVPDVKPTLPVVGTPIPIEGGSVPPPIVEDDSGDGTSPTAPSPWESPITIKPPIVEELPIPTSTGVGIKGGTGLALAAWQTL